MSLTIVSAKRLFLQKDFHEDLIEVKSIFLFASLRTETSGLLRLRLLIPNGGYCFTFALIHSQYGFFFFIYFSFFILERLSGRKSHPDPGIKKKLLVFFRVDFHLVRVDFHLDRVDFHLEIGFDSFRNLQVDKFLSKLTVSATLETIFPRSIRTSPSSSWSHLSWRRSTLAIILRCPNRIKAYVGVPRATQSVLIISRVV